MTHQRHYAPNGAAKLCHLLVAITVALGGCGSWTFGGSSRVPAQTDAIERSNVQLAKPPNAAAECIVANARAGGEAAEVVPLYGLESVAVTVRDRVAGETLAVFSLMRNGSGARADTTTWAGVPDRAAFLGKLTQGC
jgi:hypothetical protein